MKGRISLKIKIERSEKKPKKIKERKPRTLTLGPHKKAVRTLWALLFLSLSFAVYKNFTAINQHTIHEKVVIKEKLVDTSGIQSYVEAFAADYFSWQNKKESIEERTKKINQYLSEDLQKLNIDLIRSDIPTSSVVKNVHIQKVTKTENHHYQVIFSIQQEITEGKKKKTVTSSYQVTVYQDDSNGKVIIQNPTIVASAKKSAYQAKQLENDPTIDSKTVEDATKFLETFFKLYPKTSNEELDYYVKDNVLEPINKELTFFELINPIFTKDGDKLSVSVSVSYLDPVTKMTQINQYQLHLKNNANHNWEIIR